MTNVLIIEDEIKAAKELRNLIEAQDSEMKVVAITDSIKGTLKWLNENPAPNLILSDIQLTDGLSFEIFKTINLSVPIIFCTAFDEYAIQAFDTNGIDYLLKPIDEEKLSHSLQKYTRLKSAYEKNPTEQTNYKQQLDNLIQQLDRSYKASLLIYFKDKIIPIKTEDIDFFNSSDSIITAYLNDGKHYIINYNLDNLEHMLDPRIFYRANRQFIINRKAVESIEHYFTRRLAVKLRQPTPESVIVSKVKATDFLKWLED